MALQKITQYIAECDKCGHRGTLFSDPRDGDYHGDWEYWHGRQLNIGKLWLLCPDCVKSAEAWMNLKVMK